MECMRTRVRPVAYGKRTLIWVFYSMRTSSVCEPTMWVRLTCHTHTHPHVLTVTSRTSRQFNTQEITPNVVKTNRPSVAPLVIRWLHQVASFTTLRDLCTFEHWTGPCSVNRNDTPIITPRHNMRCHRRIL